METVPLVNYSLIASNSERALAAHFVSPAAEFLKSRDFQGLDFSVPIDARVGIVPGSFGTASSGYVVINENSDEKVSSHCVVDYSKVVGSVTSLVTDEDEVTSNIEKNSV